MAASTSPNPMERVISIPELLESILLNLDMTTLLVSASRVSKQWRGLITGSPAIRQALYFDPIPTGNHDGNAATVNVVLNPLLVEKFSPFFDVRNNEVYFRSVDSCCYSTPRITDLRENLSPQLDPERLHDRASWRRMLVSQPPPLQVGCIHIAELPAFFPIPVRWTRAIRFAGLRSAQFVVDTGLRMGQLYDWVEEGIFYYDWSHRWFRIHWGLVREPSYFEVSEGECQRMICQTGVVVEFNDVREVDYGDHRTWPADVHYHRISNPGPFGPIQELNHVANEVVPQHKVEPLRRDIVH